MKNKKFINIVCFILVFSLLLLPLTSAWMPSTHRYITTEAIKKAPSSPVGSIANQYTADFMCGNYLADASVFYYFSEGFTSIGKEYRSTHSVEFCKRAVSLAQRSGDNGKLAFAYGLCSHQVQDSIAHNAFVPDVIKKTNLLNGLVHALSEENIDDKVRKIDNQKWLVNNELINVCPQYKEFFIEIAQGQTQLETVDPEKLYDAFIEQVAGNVKYSLGFQSFTAVPTSIHLMLLMILVMMSLIFVFVFKIENKNKFNIISLWLVGIIAVIIVTTYILYFTGNFWQSFQTLSYPLSQPLPTANWEMHINSAIQETVNFFNGGVNYLNNIPDPSGAGSLEAADKSGNLTRIIFSIIFIGLIALFVYLNIKGGFKRKRK